MEADHKKEGEDVKPGPAFQVIILGGGGGPSENDATGLLVRSTSTNWTKSSLLAVDAGVHMAAIQDIVGKHLDQAVQISPPPKRPGRFNKIPLPDEVKRKDIPAYFAPVTEARGSGRESPATSSQSDNKNHVFTSGPFNHVMVPYESPNTIAAYLLRNLISTILITHPHLDHLSGFTINTAALQNTTRPKKLVALPHTIDAIKSHIFNDVIWPNMSDEEGGIGFVSYQRLVEGGHTALGDNAASGYIEVCDGLAVKGHTISHGHCMKRHKHRGSGSLEPSSPTTGRRRSTRNSTHTMTPAPASVHANPGSVFNWSDMHSFAGGTTGILPQWSATRCVIDSSAFFVRDEETGQEVLIFGDVEPDSISEDPRNMRVWADAAPKIAQGMLKAIFIECSYDDSQGDAVLFGHLAPRHLVAELAVLAAKITAYNRGATAPELLAATIPASTPNTALAANTPLPPSDESYRHSHGHGIANAHGHPDGLLGMVHHGGERKKRRLENGTRQTTRPRSEDGSLATTPPGQGSPRRRSKPRALRPAPSRTASGVSPMSSPLAETPVAVRGAGVGYEESAIFDGPAEIENGHDYGHDGQQSRTHMRLEMPGDSALHRLSNSQDDTEQVRPLAGVQVVIIHVKDPLKDNYDIKEVILRQCKEHEARQNLGCEFVTCSKGDSIWV